MKILFVFRYPGMLRYYQTLVRTLLKRGHEAHIYFSSLEKQAQERILETLCAEFPAQLTFSILPKVKDPWRRFNEALAWGMDYLRYLNPVYDNSWRLRRRVEIRIASDFRKLVNKIFPFNRWCVQQKIIAFFQFLYNSTPTHEGMIELIDTYKPDGIFISPLVLPGSSQADFFKAARILGIPSIYSTLSWDNLTTKGLIRGNPDKIFVWNEIQKNEAVSMHKVPASKITITGSQYFDLWFDIKPATTREAFCKKVGLNPDKPFVLYLCSSNFMAPDEKELIEQWIDKIRANPVLKDVGILIRPYPETVEQWTDDDFKDKKNVTFFPKKREYPIDGERLSHFYDSIYHSFAVVGMNTTAMIESVIVGRPVLSFLRQENYNQSHTLHFNYMRQDSGGFLIEAESIDEHLGQLAEVLTDKNSTKEARERFLRAFIRPHGENVPACEIFADALEKFLSKPKLQKKPNLPLKQRAGALMLLPLNKLFYRYQYSKRWAKHVARWNEFREILEANNDDILLAEKIFNEQGKQF